MIFEVDGEELKRYIYLKLINCPTPVFFAQIDLSTGKSLTLKQTANALKLSLLHGLMEDHYKKHKSAIVYEAII